MPSPRTRLITGVEMELLWLLLPVAALSGWFAGRRDQRSAAPRGQHLPTDYFKGLNYLLSEEPDKAIEVFTRMVEVDSDTVETHLALANLFRRRGEVDRAIRIHQNLIARPALGGELRAQALLELGLDYMRAGLLDRAESLFEQVIEFGVHVEPALRQLLLIYEAEKEWQKAATVALRLESRAGAATRAVVAQFYCEQAEQALEEQEVAQVRQLLRRALSHDSNCARASILLGQLELRLGHYRAALKAFQRVRFQDIDFLPEVLEPIRECYRQLGQPKQMIRYLHDVLPEFEGPAPMLMLADVLREQEGDAAAINFVTEQLRRRPNVWGLHRLIELTTPVRDESEDGNDGVDVLKGAFTELLRARPAYECRQCGFSGKSLYWQCPSCKTWASVKPITSIKGD